MVILKCQQLFRTIACSLLNPGEQHLAVPKFVDPLYSICSCWSEVKPIFLKSSVNRRSSLLLLVSNLWVCQGQVVAFAMNDIVDW